MSIVLCSPDSPKLGSKHPSPSVKTLCNFEPQFGQEMITSHDAKGARFKGSRTSSESDVTNLGIFWPKSGRTRSHHVMDASWLLLMDGLFSGTPPMVENSPFNMVQELGGL